MEIGRGKYTEENANLIGVCFDNSVEAKILGNVINEAHNAGATTYTIFMSGLSKTLLNMAEENSFTALSVATAMYGEEGKEELIVLMCDKAVLGRGATSMNDIVNNMDWEEQNGSLKDVFIKMSEAGYGTIEETQEYGETEEESLPDDEIIGEGEDPEFLYYIPSLASLVSVPFDIEGTFYKPANLNGIVVKTKMLLFDYFSEWKQPGLDDPLKLCRKIHI